MTAMPGISGSATAGIDIPAGEHDILRLFALDVPRHAMAEMLGDGALSATIAAQLLGVPALDHKFVELFDTEDVAELGLAGYLHDGFDVERDDLLADKAHLEGLDGFVLVLLSQAFGWQATRLHPAKTLRLVATYPLPGADNTIDRFSDPDTRARIGAVDAPTMSPASRPRLPWPLLLLLILPFAAILLWLILTLR